MVFNIRDLASRFDRFAGQDIEGLMPADFDAKKQVAVLAELTRVTQAADLELRVWWPGFESDPGENLGRLSVHLEEDGEHHLRVCRYEIR